jgi:hypothetical protein
MASSSRCFCCAGGRGGERIAGLQRHGQHTGQQRHHLRQGQGAESQRCLKLRQLVRRGRIRLEGQTTLQQLTNWCQGTVLQRRLAATLPAAVWPFGGLRFDYLHQTRFANADFSTQEDHLALPGAHWRPARPQQGDFRLAPYQGRPGAVPWRKAGHDSTRGGVFLQAGGARAGAQFPRATPGACRPHRRPGAACPRERSSALPG